MTHDVISNIEDELCRLKVMLHEIESRIDKKIKDDKIVLEKIKDGFLIRHEGMTTKHECLEDAVICIAAIFRVKNPFIN